MAEVKSKAFKVPKACDRCKKQKLKCDIERPCTLCTRSNVGCTSMGNAFQPSTTLRQTPNKRKRGGDETGGPRYVATDQSLDSQLLGQLPTSSGLSTSAESSDTEPPATTGRPRLMRRSSVSGCSPSRLSTPRPENGFVGDSSAMGLTKQVFSFNDSQQHSATSALPGGTEPGSLPSPHVLLLDFQLPPPEVIEALVDSYFDTVHWFIFILHEGSFRQQAKRVVALGQQIRRGADADFSLLLMMVVALGAQYAARNPRWKYRDLMAQHSIDVGALVPTLTRQVREHLLDSLERCQLEAVQTCNLLGTFYMFHGNPNLSWSVLGLAVKAAYALGMHREVDWKGDNILLQARKRAWGQTVIADTFAAVIYGRPTTIDQNFCNVSFPDECDDTEIPMPLRGYLSSINGGKNLSQLAYHTQKYRLYEIKGQIISKIYTLRARASFQTVGSGIPKLVKTVQKFDYKLKVWRNNLPVFFTQSNWTSGDGDPSDVFSGLCENLSEAEERIKQHLVKQKVVLQLLYDYILILLHRPLLEYRMSSRRQQRTPESSFRNPFPDSFETCMSAAMRISYIPANEFEYNCPLALVTMHMLNAGIILCIPATMDPFSTAAHKSKGAVVRMIRMFKRLSGLTPVAAQSCTILEELIRVVLKRELELVLHPEILQDRPDSDSTPHPNGRTERSQEIRNKLDDLSKEACPTSPINQTVSPPSPTHLEDSNTTEGYHKSRSHHQSSTSLADGELLQPNSFLPVNINHKQHSASTNDNNLSTISPESLGSNQAYEFIEAEPDQGFNMAFSALERVIYDVTPSDWVNPAWMHSYETTDLYPMPGNLFGGSFMGMAQESPSTTSGDLRNSRFDLEPSSAHFNYYTTGPPQVFGETHRQGNDQSGNPMSTADVRPSWQEYPNSELAKEYR